MPNAYTIFGWTFIALGVFLAIWTVVMAVQLRRDPMSVIRPQWHGIVSERFARFVGIVIIIASLAGAGFAFWAAWQVFNRVQPV